MLASNLREGTITVHCFVIREGMRVFWYTHTTVYKCKLKTVKILQHLPVTILKYTH